MDLEVPRSIRGGSTIFSNLKQRLNKAPPSFLAGGFLRFLIRRVNALMVNEGQEAPIGRLFRSLGTFFFKKGRSGSVVIGTAGTDGKYVIVDAVQFLFVGGRKG